MSKRTTRQRCPHCGNTNQGLIEDNGLPTKDEDYTLLCVARVEAKDEANTCEPRQEPDPFGLVKCGMQWCPNQEGA